MVGLVALPDPLDDARPPTNGEHERVLVAPAHEAEVTASRQATSPIPETGTWRSRVRRLDGPWPSLASRSIPTRDGDSSHIGGHHDGSSANGSSSCPGDDWPDAHRHPGPVSSTDWPEASAQSTFGIEAAATSDITACECRHGYLGNRDFCILKPPIRAVKHRCSERELIRALCLDELPAGHLSRLATRFSPDRDHRLD